MKENLRRTPGQFKKSVFPVLATTLFLSSCYGHLEGKSPDATATATPSAAAGTPTPESKPVSTPEKRINVNINIYDHRIKPNPTATKAPAPTSSPEATKIVPVFCHADQIGIWAPDVNGTPERFEIDSTQANTEIVATIWIPGGIIPPETEFLLQLKGRRIEVIGAGTAWKYNTAECSAQTINAEVQAHVQRRTAEGKTTIVVTVEQFAQMSPHNVKTLPGDRGSS